MKFQQLKIGQKFEYQGNTYVKSSPLLASQVETGEQKLIPRYAAIVVMDASLSQENKTVSRQINTDLVQAAFDKFYAEALDALAAAGSQLDKHKLESIQSRLELSRDVFFNELQLSDLADKTS